MRKRSGRLQRLILITAVFPLAAAGPCSLIAQEALVNGFFGAITPLLNDALAARLGVTASSTGTGQNSGDILAPSGTGATTSGSSTGGDLLTPTTGWTGNGFNSGTGTGSGSGTSGSGSGSTAGSGSGSSGGNNP